MIDLHHHLLFGLDDGAPDLETSVAMAHMAYQDGITHIVCTPHASGQYEFRPDQNAARLDLLREALAAENIPIILGLGCDFHLSYDNIQDAIAHPAKYAINGTQYLLVELPDYGLPRTLGETFYEMRLAGLTPILTHPERNPTLQNNHDLLADWLRAGLILQLTAGSVLGVMGRTAQQMSERLLADRWVQILATDAHNITRRPPEMREAAKIIAGRYGQGYADLLTLHNPQAIFQGDPLPPQQPMLHLFAEDPDEADSPSPWYRRLLRR